jgi:hypothetical protein
MPNFREVNGKILYHGQWYEDERDLRMAMLEEEAENNEQRLMFLWFGAIVVTICALAGLA